MKKRSILVIIVSVAIALINVLLPLSKLIFNGNLFMEDFPAVHNSIVVISILNVYFAISLLFWKKSGFWGLLITANVLVFIYFKFGIQLLGNPLQIVIGLASLFSVLQIKSNGVSTWKQLE